MDFQKLFRPHILNLQPYNSARDEYSGADGIFLDANENPLGSSASGSYNRYPDPYQRDIKNKISALKKVSIDSIFLGNGSDEPIDLIIQATCKPLESEMIIMPPTYGMYKVCADIHQVKIIEAPLTKDFEIQKELVSQSIHPNTKLIWCCSPNNPSGNLLNSEVILNLAEENPEILVVVDEAYIDFAPTSSLLSALKRYPNLMILQTFSKAWGLAALRIGVAYANPAVVRILNKIKYPYNINIETQLRVLEALENEGLKDKYVQEIKANKDFIEKALMKFPMVEKVFPSDSNQLLVKFKDSSLVFKHLLDQKIIVRDRSKVMHCDNCLRISIGTRQEMESLLEALEKI